MRIHSFKKSVQFIHGTAGTSAKLRFLALFVALLLCFSCCSALAESPASSEEPPGETGEKTDEFAPSGGGLAEDGEMDEFGSSGGSAAEGGDGLPMLTEDSFSADDIPDDMLTPTKQKGRVEKVRYTTDNSSSADDPFAPSSSSSASDETDTEDVKSVLVYLPYGYDDSQEPYDILYLLHASGGSMKNYLDTDRVTELQCLLDRMIENGKLKPLIVVAASYYPSQGITQFLPLMAQVTVTASFPQEMVEDILPAVESQYRTYAASASEEDLVASRDHRGIAGFSLGGVATWYMFLQEMRMFKWFLPISEASWDDGEGGTSGIWDSDVSAQVLYDAVVAQGYAKNDFRLYVATGTEDEAFDISTSQMASLLEYDDMFKPGENTSCSMMLDGTHTLRAVYTYLYHILPSLFLNE